MLRSWPIKSVMEMHGPLEPKAGFGFFWAQRFLLDGQPIHLHGLENDILRERYPDARIHATLNCASASCPDLESSAFSAGDLEQRLSAAARRFVEDPRHVQVDHKAGVIRLSAIFDWYSGDFEQEAGRQGKEETALSWIIAQSSAAKGTAIKAAQAQRSHSTIMTGASTR